MSALRIYVAGASAEVDLCAEYIGRLRDAGAIITHDWTADVLAARATGTTDEQMTPGQRRACAAADLQGVASADIMWLIAPSNASTGAWTELGYAIGVGTYILVSGACARRSIFVEGRRCVATHEEAFRELVERNASMLAEVA